MRQILEKSILRSRFCLAPWKLDESLLWWVSRSACGSDPGDVEAIEEYARVTERTFERLTDNAVLASRTTWRTVLVAA